MTMLSTTERDAIHDWIVAASGLPGTSVVWADQRAPQIPAGIYVELRCSDPVPFGQDWDDLEQLEAEVDGHDLRHRMRGVRNATLEISLYPHGVKWKDAQPMRRLNTILSARNLPLRRQALRAGGIGFGTIGKIMDMNLERSTLFEPRAVVEVVIHLASEVTELGQSIRRVEVVNEIETLEAGGGIAIADATFAAEADDDQLELEEHGLQTGDGPVRVTEDAPDSLPDGLSPGTDYWVVKVDEDHVRLATSRDNALAGSAIDLTTDGTGTIADAAGTTRVAFDVTRED